MTNQSNSMKLLVIIAIALVSTRANLLTVAPIAVSLNSSALQASQKSTEAASSTSTTVQSTVHNKPTVTPTTIDDSIVSEISGGLSATSLSTASISTVSQIDVVEPPPEQPIFNGHETIGTAGPDKREVEGIQKALDWLREKRSPDYGWDNDTHMVILANEVSLLGQQLERR